MKRRTRFVSNSSSSSFIIACKEGHLKKEMEAVIEDTKNIVSPFNFATIAKDLVHQMVRQADVEIKSFEEIENEWCYTREEFERYYPGVLDKIENEGWMIYYGSVYDDEPENMLLVAMEIDHKSDTLIIKKDSHY